MRKIEELSGVDCVDSDDLGNAAEQLLYVAQIIIDLQKPRVDTDKKLTAEQEMEEQLQVMQKNPLLVSCMAMLATLERFRVDYAYQQNSTQLLLQDIAESIDCAGAKAPLADSTKITALPAEHATFNCLTDKESKVIYEALKKSYLDGLDIEPSGQDHELAMSRIERIANGRCFNA